MRRGVPARGCRPLQNRGLRYPPSKRCRPASSSSGRSGPGPGHLGEALDPHRAAHALGPERCRRRPCALPQRDQRCTPSRRSFAPSHRVNFRMPRPDLMLRSAWKARLEARTMSLRLPTTQSQLRPAAEPAPSSAAFSRSCARAFGRDLTGVSRTAGFSISPASPRKRATLSVGSAPTPSQ